MVEKREEFLSFLTLSKSGIFLLTVRVAIILASMALLMSYLAATAANPIEPAHTFLNYTCATVDSIRFDGVGGLSAGATSPFLFAYEPSARAEILDWMFKPDFAGSLDILKVSNSHLQIKKILKPCQLMKMLLHRAHLDTQLPYKTQGRNRVR